MGEKLASISTMANTGYSISAIEKELVKCELVCSNCHRKRTHIRWVVGRSVNAPAS